MNEKIFVKPKRKISEIEQLYDLEKHFSDINKKQKTEQNYTLKIAGAKIFLGKFEEKFNLEHLAEFLEISPTEITQIENKEFIRNDNVAKTIKATQNNTFNYVKIHISLISYEIRMQLYSNGIFLIRNCASLSNAQDAVEKFLFNIKTSKLKHLFYQ